MLVVLEDMSTCLLAVELFGLHVGNYSAAE